MSHILAISSWVAHGHVGLSAIAPVLQALGHNVTQLPTTLLSNHPGFEHAEGNATPVGTLRSIIAALEANGWLETVDTVLTGYLPSAAHVDVAIDLIERLPTARPSLVIDPVLGDHPKGLYIPREAADALRNDLVAKADIITPNLFELSWLTGRDTTTLHETSEAARYLCSLGRLEEVIVTSPLFSGGSTGLLSVTASDVVAFEATAASQDELVPHGVGDAFSALVSAKLPTGQALGCLQALIHSSLGGQHLRIAETANVWTTANSIGSSVV